MATLALGMLIGCSIVLQSGVNAELRRAIGSPSGAAFVSFVVGSAAVGVVVLLAADLHLGRLSAAPWWSWLGGLLGAFNIIAAIVVAARRGAAVLVACVAAGQVTTSLLLDHFGLFGYAARGVTPGRVVGAALVLAGVLLVSRR